MKVLQTNLQRRAREHDVAYATAMEKGVDILVVGEPNTNTVKGANWIKDENGDVAVLLINRNIKVFGVSRGLERVTLDMDAFRLTCCYTSPNIGLEAFCQHAEKAFDTVEEGKEVVVVGDINAKSPEWGSPVWDRRGEIWTEWMGTKGMEVLNDGKEPTWRKGNQSSYIDVTCATRKVAGKIKGWTVLPDESLSDHAFVFVEVVGERSGVIHTWRARLVLDESKLERTLREELSRMTGETLEVVEALKRAQEASEVRRERRQTSPPYWWNGEIERARRDCVAARRNFVRARRRNNDGNEEDIREENVYKDRRMLAGLTRSSKRTHWKDLCEELEEDIWGKGYEIVTRGIKRSSTPYELPHDTKMEIARQLFPREEEWEMQEEIEQLPDVPPFTTEEVLDAVGKLKRRAQARMVWSLRHYKQRSK